MHVYFWNSSQLVFAVFAIGSWPVIVRDLDEMQIPTPWLLSLLVSAALVAAVQGPDAWGLALLGGALILALGILVCWLLPDKIGEADILYVACFPFFLAFFPLLFSLGLACSAGMASFAIRVLRNADSAEGPIAFIPMLFWGASAQVLIGGTFT